MRGLFSEQKCEEMVKKMEYAIATKQPKRELPNNKKGINAYSIHEMFPDEQLEVLFETSDLVGEVLVPTYNFTRKYIKGSILRKHKDRPACEHSLTINFGVHEKPWTFFCEVNDKIIGIDLDPGDALYYTGQDVAHWREPLETDYCYQTFFHYVEKDGECKEEMHELENRPDTSGHFKYLE